MNAVARTTKTAMATTVKWLNGHGATVVGDPGKFVADNIIAKITGRHHMQIGAANRGCDHLDPDALACGGRYVNQYGVFIDDLNGFQGAPRLTTFVALHHSKYYLKYHSNADQ